MSDTDYFCSPQLSGLRAKVPSMPTLCPLPPCLLSLSLMFVHSGKVEGKRKSVFKWRFSKSQNVF